MNKALAALIPVFALAAACSSGSGGGGNQAPTPPTVVAPPTPPAPPAFPKTATDPGTFPATPNEAAQAAARRSYEAHNAYDPGYFRQLPDGRVFSGTDNHLSLIKASHAYARGATGSGETVVVVDSGVDASHPKLTGKVRVITGIGNSCSPEDAAAGICAGAGHGTAVASIVAGNRGPDSTGLDIHGVAFGANVNFIPIVLRGDPRSSPPLLELNAYRWDQSSATRGALDRSSTYTQYLQQGKILSFSFGFPWAISEWQRLGGNCGEHGETGDLACYRSYYRSTAEALAQAGIASADKSIVVMAAGNGNGVRYDIDLDGNRQTSDAENMGGAETDATSSAASNLLPYAFPELELGHILNVVAVGADGEISSYSNRCGVAKEFCLAAPGGDISTSSDIEADSMNVDVGILFARAGGGYSSGHGTSFAAPIVSGSLALLRHFFRNADGSYSVGNTELVTRLLATADRTGRYADSDIYGHGLLNLDAATRPVGTVSISTTERLDGPRIAAEFSHISPGNTMGDALNRAFHQREMAVFDELGAPFRSAAASMTKPYRTAGIHERIAALRNSETNAPITANFYSRPLSDPSFTPGLRSAMAKTQIGDIAMRAEVGGFSLSVVRNRSTGHTNPFAGLTGMGMQAALQSGPVKATLLTGKDLRSESQQRRSHGILLESAVPAGGNAFTADISTGVLIEPGGFAGTHGAGAFATPGGRTFFAGTKLRYAARGWEAFAELNYGMTHGASQNSGLIRSTSNLLAGAYAFGVERGNLRISLRQPLRIESGKAHLRWVSGRDRYRKLNFEDHRIELRPMGRQIDFEALYTLPIENGSLKLGAVATRHPGHFQSAKPEFQAFMGVDAKF